jgi:hypothetical protein
MGGDSQLKFAQQQRQQALDAGDAKAVEAWDKEIRKVNQGRLGAAMDAQDASQTGLFGVTEYDNSMPLFDQSKLDAEEARLAAEYKERDTAMQQEVARAEREAMGYHDMTFDQKKAEAGIAEGWVPKELPPATSKAGKDLTKKINQLEEILSNSRDVRLPAAIDRRDRLAAQGMPTQQMDELIDQLTGQVTKSQAQLDKLRAEYGIEPAAPAPMGVREKFLADVAANVDLLRKAAVKAMAEGNETLATKFETFANAGRPGTPRTELPIQRDIDEAKAYLRAPEAAAPPALPKTMLAAGETVRTASGRETTPFPKFNLASKGGAARATKSADRWLLENAAAEARARGDDFNASSFEAEAKQKTIPQASKDAAEEYLFGQQPPVQEPVLRDLGLNPAATKAQFDDLAATLRQVDGGKLKGVSKKALDAAEKGDPEQALAEATDYAKRRLAEIDNKIESIKQRAIEEGC